VGQGSAVDFGLSQEQEQLKSQVRRFLDAECPVNKVRALVESEEPYDTGLWAKVSELGWPAIVVPEEHGGLGMAWEDVAVVAEETGRSLFPAPFIPDVVAARAINELGTDEQRGRYLPDIAAGSLIAALAMIDAGGPASPDSLELSVSANGSGLRLDGVKDYVAWGQAAGLLLFPAREAGGVSLFAVPSAAEGLTITPLTLIDPTKRAARIELDGVWVTEDQRLGQPGKAWEVLECVLDAATVALAAEMTGAADAAVALATKYAKVREQFGQPIGRFQGIKHRLAELHVGVESSRSLAYYASWAVDNATDVPLRASMAMARASETLEQAGEECIQVHGAIGFTWECDAHFYYKRSRYSRNLLGSPEYHNERVLSVQGI